MEKKKNTIKGFRDLDVYCRTYTASIEVMKKIVPVLPDNEKYDLKDQLARSSKSIPRLIAEGYAKRHQKRGFQKYLDDAMAESNETIVSLCHCRDIYESYVNIELCEELIDTYEIAGKQLYKLERSWSQFEERKKTLT